MNLRILLKANQFEPEKSQAKNDNILKGLKIKGN